MTRADLEALRPGDILLPAGSSEAVIVTANYGNRVTAVRTFNVTNPGEWVLVRKVETARER